MTSTTFTATATTAIATTATTAAATTTTLTTTVTTTPATASTTMTSIEKMCGPSNLRSRKRLDVLVCQINNNNHNNNANNNNNNQFLPPPPEVSRLSQISVLGETRSWEDVLSKLTVEECVGLVSGRDFWHNGGVPRLSVPALQVTDGPSGARGPDLQTPSACVPCGVALGATWNEALCTEVGALLGRETRAKGAQILLAPTVNLQRVPTAGRHFECFSEDPDLTSRLAVAYIRGVQSVSGVGACVKHLVANDQEQDRMSVSAEVTERTLRRVYLRPFEAAVKEGGAVAVMTGYNRLNGTFCSQHSWLLRDILRGEWGFQGLVMSDWFGTHSTESCLAAGLDLEMPYRRDMFYGDRLLQLAREGKVSEAELRSRAASVLRVMGQLGLLEESAREQRPHASRNGDADRELLRRAAEESIVLLKNDKNLLPLPSTSHVAVIGANAQRLTLQGGGSPQVLLHPANRSVVDALGKCLSEGGCVTWELGCDTASYLPPLGQDCFRASSGDALLEMSVFLGKGWPQGSPIGSVPVHSMEPQAVFKGLMFHRNPVRPKSREPWSARLVTRLIAAEAGRYEFGLGCSGRARLRVNGRLLLAEPQDDETRRRVEQDILAPLPEKRAELILEAGETLELEVDWIPDRLRAQLMIGCRRRDWVDESEMRHRAVAAAKLADAVVVVVGTDEVIETEGKDQDSMDLPVAVVKLIEELIAANPRTVVCLNAGSPKNLCPWVDKVGAVVSAWFGGQEGAEALGAALVDGASHWGPSGRLPFTWPRSLSDCPTGPLPGPQYPGENGRVLYAEGEQVGYRWYAARGIAPLFSFGHGLSYAQFEFVSRGRLPESRLISPGQDVTLHVAVKNVGERRGKEVVQAYLSSRGSTRSLAAFAKVELEVGEEGDAVLLLTAARLQLCGSEAPDEPLAKGSLLHVFVGRSAEDVSLRQILEVV
ncbi:unnamed protein product [Polarella glacialis]|uniref:beta-glucosidase n=1 Tax=Polarella glacialis TaxID=89957 RepID=A0A813JW59_POLGL|nr:unnamed protein product [Polarella glacialis]